MSCWKILGLEPTENEQRIKDAYFAQLEFHHPEEDPEGFKELRNAYEEALRELKEKKKVPEDPEVAAWMEKVEAVYDNFKDRLDLSKWEALLKDPICLNLETEKAVNEALLVYMMDHFYLPHYIYEMLEGFFNWEDKEEELCEDFPENFIRYIINHSKYGDVLRYERFVWDEKADFEDFISDFFDFRQAINEDEYDNAKRCLERLEKSGIQHPDLEVQKIRYYLYKGEDNEKAWELACKLRQDSELKEIDLFWIIRAGLANGYVSEMEQPVKLLLEADPENPQVMKLKGDYEFGLEHFNDAAEWYQKASDASDEEDERIESALIRANKKLTEEYSQTLKEDIDAKTDELLWKLSGVAFKGQEFEVMIDALEHLENKESDLPRYLYLMAEGLHYLERYQEAIPYREKILELIENGTEIGEQEFKYGDLGLEYAALDEPEKALPFFEKGLEINPESKQLAYQKAKALLRAGRYKEADEYSETVLKKSFYSPVFGVKVRALLNLGEYEYLTNIVEELLSQGFEDNDVFMCYAIALRRTERYDEAREYLDILKSRLGPIGAVVYEEARLEYDRENYEEALKKTEEYLKDHPDYESAEYLKADILRDMERYEEAKEIYLKQIERGTADELGYYRLAGVYYILKQYEKAAEHYQEAIRLYPKYYSAMNELGDSYQSLGRYEDAVIQYTKALDRENAPARWYLDLVRILRRLKRLAEAAEIGKKGIETYPDYMPLYLAVARAYWDAKQYEECISYYEKYSKFEGKEAYSLGEIADCYVKMKQFDKAEEIYQKSIDADPEKDTGYRAIGLYYLRNKKDYEKAVLYLLKAFERDDEDSYVAFCIGDAYKKAGKPEDANHYFQRALTISLKDLEEEEDACNYESLSDIYLQLGDFEKAIEMAEKALSMSYTCFTCPGCSCYEAYEDMSKAYEGLGDYKQALDYMKKAEEIKSHENYKEAIKRLEERLK